MGLACYTGSYGFYENWDTDNFLYHYYTSIGKVLLKPPDDYFFDIYKLYLVVSQIKTNDYRALRDSLQRWYSKFESVLQKLDYDRWKILRVFKDYLPEMGSVKLKELYSLFDAIDKSYVNALFINRPTYIFSIKNKLCIEQFFDENIKEYFRHYANALDIDLGTIVDIDEAIRRVKFGDYSLLDSAIDKLTTISQIKTLPHLGGALRFVGVQVAWGIITYQAQNSDYHSWYVNAYFDYLKRYGEPPPPSLFSALYQSVLGNPALSDYLYHLYVGGDNVLQKNLKWKVWNDLELSLYYFGKTVGLPFIGESISGYVEENVLTPLFIRSLQSLALRSSLARAVFGFLFSDSLVGLISSAILSMSVAFLAGLVIEGALAIAYYKITYDLYELSLARRWANLFLGKALLKTAKYVYKKLSEYEPVELQENSHIELRKDKLTGYIESRGVDVVKALRVCPNRLPPYDNKYQLSYSTGVKGEITYSGSFTDDEKKLIREFLKPIEVYQKCVYFGEYMPDDGFFWCPPDYLCRCFPSFQTHLVFKNSLPKALVSFKRFRLEGLLNPRLSSTVSRYSFTRKRVGILKNLFQKIKNGSRIELTISYDPFKSECIVSSSCICSYMGGVLADCFSIGHISGSGKTIADIRTKCCKTYDYEPIYVPPCSTCFVSPINKVTFGISFKFNTLIIEKPLLIHKTKVVFARYHSSPWCAEYKRKTPPDLLFRSSSYSSGILSSITIQIHESALNTISPEPVYIVPLPDNFERQRQLNQRSNPDNPVGAQDMTSPPYLARFDFIEKLKIIRMKIET